MHVVTNLVGALLRMVLKLALIAIAAVVALALLFGALVTLVLVLLKALLTGRKPTLVTAFVRFRQAQQQFKRGNYRGAWSSGHSAEGFARPTPDDVVDVQAHEVGVTDKRLPPGL